MMHRREFITLVGGMMLAPSTARAQEPGRTYRLGDLHLSPRNHKRDRPHFAAMMD